MFHRVLANSFKGSHGVSPIGDDPQLGNWSVFKLRLFLETHVLILILQFTFRSLLCAEGEEKISTARHNDAVQGQGIYSRRIHLLVNQKMPSAGMITSSAAHQR